MSGTTVDAALTALVAAFTAAVPAGWTVLDGGPGVEEPEPNVVYVGYSSDDMSPDVTCTPTPADAAGLTNWEHYTVACELTGWDAKAVIANARTEALAAYNLLAAALTADPFLGGSVARARMGQFTLVQTSISADATVTVRFNVEIDASK